ncbi:hypothetical protein FPQ18DRAFT_332843 [Pyronema domesticum]|nr:hypothetical protein FPQ18DRAFT_332843 [Pyronema domesticum]
MSGLTNYVAYESAAGTARVGHLDLSTSQITPLSFKSGAYLTSIYQVIEIGSNNIIASAHTEPIALSSVKLLAPLAERDVLCVGKNYAEHAREFNQSGFDSSDKVDVPSHPVIFTKRATSIIPSGHEIYRHSSFTQSVDYEGEIGVIIGKAGFQIPEEKAAEYVWGYTIINDMTARERQRDHKQFYIGKSPDSFCPMGPIAVPASALPATLEVQTTVNGEPRQKGDSSQLIFSIPNLIATLSAGQTLQPGDVLATGTPAGVGIGRNPPLFLQPGDQVDVSITGLGTLSNKISAENSANATASRAPKSVVPITNADRAGHGFAGLTTLPSGKKLFVRQTPASGEKKGTLIFVHGLGGTHDFYTPLIRSLSLNTNYETILFDLEGHGLSPTSAASIVSINSYASDVGEILSQFRVSKATIVAHSMGTVVAQVFALSNAQIVERLVLLGPPPSPLPAGGVAGSHARAALVREKGMIAVADAVVASGTSVKTQNERPLGVAATRMSLLAQTAEGYAKGCVALAGAGEEGVGRIELNGFAGTTLVVTGDEDKVSPPALVKKMEGECGGKLKAVVLEGVGHWHLYEDVDGVSKAVGEFLL